MFRLREILSFPARQSRTECVNEWLEANFSEMVECRGRPKYFSSKEEIRAGKADKMS